MKAFPGRGLVSAAAASTLVLAMAACSSETPSDPTSTKPSFQTVIDLGHLFLCKQGTDANFTVSVNGGAGTPVSVANGTCQDVAQSLTSTSTVDITELVDPTTQVLDSIVVKAIRVGGTTQTTLTGTATASTTVNGDTRREVTYYNSPFTPPPPSDQGCTPGYWKQPQHFDSWVTYSPGQAFSSVFEDAFPGLSLLQVLQTGGGGLQALGRHTVAALLNASSGINFGLTTQQVIDAFNAVFPGGDYEGQKNAFASLNERTCPLN